MTSMSHYSRTDERYREYLIPEHFGEIMTDKDAGDTAATILCGVVQKKI